MAKKPGIQEILDIAAQLKDIYAARDGQFEEDERFYELDFAQLLDIPNEFKNQVIVLPTPREIVDTIADNLAIDNVRVFCNKKGTTQHDDDEQEMARKFGTGVVYITNTSQSISPWRVGAKHYPVYGLTYFKIYYDSETKGIPIVIKAVNPHNVWPDPATDGQLYVIEHYERTVYDIKRRYPNWRDPKNREIKKENAICYSYWDDEWRCEIIDGEAVLPLKGRRGAFKHKYGLIPFVAIDSGLGNVSYDGKFEKRFVGCLRYLKNLLVAQSRQYSMADIVLKKTALPWGYLEPEVGASPVATTIDTSFGTYNPLPPGVKGIKDMVPQTPPAMLLALFEMTTDILYEHGAPRALTGAATSGVRSGAHERIKMAQAAAKLRYPDMAFKNRTARVLEIAATIYKNAVPGDVRLWARTATDDFDEVIDKKLLVEPFNFHVEFAPVSEEDEYRRHDDVERLAQSGLVSMETSRKRLSNIDPKREAVEIEKQRIQNDPNYQMEKSILAITMMRNAIQKKVGAEMLLAGHPIAPPPGVTLPQQQGGMTTDVPQRATPGSAQDLQNQIAARKGTSPVGQQGQGGGGERGANR